MADQAPKRPMADDLNPGPAKSRRTDEPGAPGVFETPAPVEIIPVDAGGIPTELPGADDVANLNSGKPDPKRAAAPTGPSYKGVPESVLASRTSKFPAQLPSGGASQGGPGMMVVGGSGGAASTGVVYPGSGMVKSWVMGQAGVAQAQAQPQSTMAMVPAVTVAQPSHQFTISSLPQSALGAQEAIQTYRPSSVMGGDASGSGASYVQVTLATNCHPVPLSDSDQLMQQPMSTETLVKCPTRDFDGDPDGRFRSQKLWKKYGEKIVQPGRNKQGSAITPGERCVKRSYFRCYNKACPARMTVDVLIDTAEQLAPVASGAHTHPFEIYLNTNEDPTSAQPAAPASNALSAPPRVNADPVPSAELPVA